MSNTLRRKMFKLGGSANTHGVGITSGLKMNKGGRVGFQPGGAVTRGGPFSRSTPFFKFALPGSPNFDPNFAPLREQLQPTKEALARLTGGGILESLGIGGDPNFKIGQNLPQEGGFLDPKSFKTSDEIRQNVLDQSISIDKNNIATDDTGNYKPLFTYDNEGEVTGLTERGEESSKTLLGNTTVKTLKENLDKPTLEEEAAIAKEKRDAVEAITTAEKQTDIQEIEGDDASSLEEDPDSFESDVKERAEILQSLFETDSKSDVLAQALIQGGAQLLEGGGAESYQKAAKAVGDVFTESAKTRRAVKNLATSQAIKDVTAEKAAEALSASQAELYGMKLLAEAAKGSTLSKKDEAALYTDLLELGGEAYADDYMAIYKSGFDTKRLPILPGAKPGQELEKIDETKLVPGEVYIYNGRYFGTNAQGVFEPFTTLIDAEQHSKS
jgi:hypothetical protein